jgi:hypothetical protein
MPVYRLLSGLWWVPRGTAMVSIAPGETVNLTEDQARALGPRVERVGDVGIQRIEPGAPGGQEPPGGPSAVPEGNDSQDGSIVQPAGAGTASGAPAESPAGKRRAGRRSRG